VKKSLFRITGLMALAFVAATQVVRAQEPVLVTIPFAFTAGEKTLPAGEYRVEKAAQGSLALMIRRIDGSEGTFVTSMPAARNKPETQSKLIFHRYGKQYFLSQIWVAGYAQGSQLRESAKEREQALSANNGIPAKVKVTIVASLYSPKP